MNDSLSSYTLKGTKSYTMKMNSSILALEALEYGKMKSIKGTLVALDN